jgi:predicted SAM-dependent methyltransferase
MLNINVGGAKHRIENGEWKVLDILPSADYVYDLNSLLPFPLEDESVDNYYTSMTLEHLHRVHLEFVLSEMYRTLKFRGKLRVVVPDINFGVSSYITDPQKMFTDGYPTQPDPILAKFKVGRLLAWFYTGDRKVRKHAVANGHKLAFDLEMLTFFLEQAGFTGVERSTFNAGKGIFKGLDLIRYATYGLFVNCKKELEINAD